MKREFLKKLIEGITDEQVQAIMDENGSDIETAKKSEAKVKDTEIATLTTERDGFKEQLEQRDKDIEDLKAKSDGNEDLKKQFEDLQTKYTTDTTSLTEKLTKQARTHAVEKFFDGYKFSSDLAKKAAMAEFEEKAFKLEDGKFLGGEDYINSLKEAQPAAFVTEKEPEPNTPPETKPQFSKNSHEDGSKGEPNPFAFGFTPVRTQKD